MNKANSLRAVIGLVIIVMGNLQAWDSDVGEAGVWIVLLVSLAIAIPAVALLTPLRHRFFYSAFGVSLMLIAISRLISPIPLPGLFLVLIPTAMGLIFTGITERGTKDRERLSSESVADFRK